jgi:hypothetical protein
LADNHYEYTDRSFLECNLIEPFDASPIDPPADISYRHASSPSPTSTIPSLSPANSHSSFGSPCGSSTSFTDSMPTSPSSRDSSPVSCHSVSSNASPPPPSTPPSASPKSGRSTKEKRSLPADRIRRPANPFMCFRTYFCKNKPRELERHNATVSKITGIAWKKLSDEEKLPYIAQAAVIKAEFMAKHPEWRFRPNRKRPEAKNGEHDSALLLTNKDTRGLRWVLTQGRGARSSSGWQKWQRQWVLRRLLFQCLVSAAVANPLRRRKRLPPPSL